MARISNIGGGSGGTTSSTTLSPATRVIAPFSSGFKADYYTDGVADWVQIIQALTDIKNIGGGKLFFHPGTYNLNGGNSMLTCSSNTVVQGSGVGNTIFKGATGHTVWGVVKTSVAPNQGQNLYFSDFTWDCTDNSGNPHSGVTEIHGYNNIHLKNIYVNYPFGYGAFFFNCKGVYIDHCTWTKPVDGIWDSLGSNDLLQFKGVDQGYVDNCYFYGVSHDVAIENHASGGVYNVQSGKTVITNCTFESCFMGINLIESTSDGGTEVANCVFKNMDRHAISIGNISNFYVHDNVIEGMNTTRSDGCNAILHYPNAFVQKNGIISNNFIHDCFPTYGGTGIHFRSTPNIKVEGNIICNSRLSGIFCRASNTKILNNKIYDDQNVSTMLSGIILDGTVSNCNIISNTCRNMTQYGIRFVSANDNIKIIDNKLQGNVFGFRLDGTPSNNNIMVGNDFSGNTNSAVNGTMGTGWEIGHNEGY